MERFTANHYIDYIIKKKNINLEDVKVGEVVILSWFSEVIDYFKNKYDEKPFKERIFGTRTVVHNLEIDGKIVTVAHATIGAPATIALMEELIAAGAKKFIGVGLCGSLNKNLPIGSLLIPYNCIREEGTSYHYIDEGKVYPDKKLFEVVEEAFNNKGYKYQVGTQWTTDAIYRETIEKIEKHINNQVCGVDMETSAMYALGIFRNISVCNILIVSDELWHEWNPGFGGEKVGIGFKKTIEVLEDIIRKI